VLQEMSERPDDSGPGLSAQFSSDAAAALDNLF
jgi:hypothetical protein